MGLSLYPLDISTSKPLNGEFRQVGLPETFLDSIDYINRYRLIDTTGTFERWESENQQRIRDTYKKAP